MSEQQHYAVARRLAAILLLREGELGLSDIEGLPFGDNPEVTDAIVRDLVREYGAVEASRRLPGTYGAWERTIRLPQATETEALAAG